MNNSEIRALIKLSLNRFFFSLIDHKFLFKGDDFTNVLFYVMLHFAYNIPAFLVGSILFPPFLPLVLIDGAFVFDFKRLMYNLNYKNSEWYKNTGLKPSQVVNDIGLYGEYVATVSASYMLKKNNVHGKIFNSVIVDKKDGNFNEIDVVVVSELGIHVIEVKARVGEFYGAYGSEVWQQVCGNDVNEIKNPFVQNLGHINFLAAYIQEKIALPSLHNISVFSLCTNVCLFALKGVQTNISDHSVLNMPWFCGDASAHYANYIFENRLIKIDEVDEICRILSELPQYTNEQKAAMVEKRNNDYNAGEFKHHYKYYVSYGRLPGENHDVYLVCRSDGYYTWYYDTNDKQFKIELLYYEIKRSYQSSNFQEMLEAAQRGEIPLKPKPVKKPQKVDSLFETIEDDESPFSKTSEDSLFETIDDDETTQDSLFEMMEEDEEEEEVYDDYSFIPGYIDEDEFFAQIEEDEMYEEMEAEEERRRKKEADRFYEEFFFRNYDEDEY